MLHVLSADGEEESKGPRWWGRCCKKPRCWRQKREADLKQEVQENLALKKQADKLAQRLAALQGTAAVSAKSDQLQCSLPMSRAGNPL